MARDKKTRRSTHPHKQNAHDGGDGKVKTPRSVASSPNTRTAHALATRPTVAIIGAGRLGSALAIALGECGYNVAALVSRRAAHAKRAARATNSQTLALGASQLNLISATDLLFFTTPDDQIARAAARFAETFSASATEVGRRRPRVALHASGALSSDALAPLRPHGFAVGSLHPLVSVSDARDGAKNLRGAFYAVEGDAPALRAARRVVRALGGQSFSVAARDKALYHAAAVITSGHTVALFDLAAGLLARCGLTGTRARQVLLPLLASTLDNLRTRTPERALTGTFARADLSTVRKHLDALGGDETLDALAVYALLGERSLQLAARRGGADARVLTEIALLLRRAHRG